MTDFEAGSDPDAASNSDAVTESGGRGLAGHAVVLFVITTAGFLLALGLHDFLSGDWPWFMIEAIPAATAATTLLVGLIYAVRAGIDG